jgi:hypothetical protein
VAVPLESYELKVGKQKMNVRGNESFFCNQGGWKADNVEMKRVLPKSLQMCAKENSDV